MAGTPIYVGFNTLNFSSFRVEFTPKGMVTHFRVDCPTNATLVAYFNFLVPFGAAISWVNPGGGNEQALDVSIPGSATIGATSITEVFFDNWELLTNDDAVSMFQDPVTLGILNYNDKVVLSRLTRDGGTIAEAVSSCNSDATAGSLNPPTAANGGTAQGTFQAPTTGSSIQLVLEILKGQTDYDAPSYVLRHTSYCSPTQNYNSSTAGTMQIYTTAQLLSEISSGWTYNCPARLTSKIAGVPIQSAPADEAPYHRWGWLKKITREPVLPNFIVEVNTEYELALWSNLRYLLH